MIAIKGYIIVLLLAFALWLAYITYKTSVLYASEFIYEEDSSFIKFILKSIKDNLNYWLRFSIIAIIFWSIFLIFFYTAVMIGIVGGA